MKKFVFPIDSHQAYWMFAPIRSKRMALELLIRTIKVMLTPTFVDALQQQGAVTLAVSKMSRLIYRSETKVFSIAFPFQVREQADHLHFYSTHHPNIDNRVTSELLALIDDSSIFVSPDVLDFADPICTASDLDSDIWNLFRDLLLSEEGYLRYDDDPANAKGHRHPRHHIDLFYSQGTTFKTGLRSAISENQFLDIVDIETDCHYLQSAL